MSKSFHVAIVGATGAVGVEMLRVLEEREFPVSEVSLLASSRSVGKEYTFRDRPVQVKELTEEAFKGVDIALFSAGAGISRQFAPKAVEAGAVVVDNSSAFRMEESVPLVIPEINGDDVKKHKGIIANPNCSTAITLMALHPLHKQFGVRRIFACTYQAVSGSGAKAIEELRAQVDAIGRGEEKIPREVYPYQIAFNVIPQVDQFLESGYTKEEIKMQNEARRILHYPTFKASVTCVRVPVYRAHSIAVHAEFKKPVTVDEARHALSVAPGVRVEDDPTTSRYPVPLAVAGQDNCYVGRLRLDHGFENGLAFWVVGDQLLKGAALNAVQIAECVVAL